MLPKNLHFNVIVSKPASDKLGKYLRRGRSSRHAHPVNFCAPGRLARRAAPGMMDTRGPVTAASDQKLAESERECRGDAETI